MLNLFSSFDISSVSESFFSHNYFVLLSCSHSHLSNLFIQSFPLNPKSILKCVDSFTASTNKNIRLALATVLLNASSYLKSTGNSTNSEDIADIFLITVGNICGSGVYETEAIVRVIVALGTAVMIGDVWRNKAKGLNMGSMLNHIASQHGEKAKAIVGEIQTIL